MPGSPIFGRTSFQYLLLQRWRVCVCLATAQLVGSWFSDQGLNSGPPQWKHQILTTGLPGSSWMVNVLWSALNSAYWECLFSSLYSKALDITLWDIFNFLLPSFDHTWREKMPFKQFPKSFPSWTISTQSGSTYTIFSKNFMGFLCVWFYPTPFSKSHTHYFKKASSFLCLTTVILGLPGNVLDSQFSVSSRHGL